jgi:hypothetical protein
MFESYHFAKQYLFFLFCRFVLPARDSTLVDVMDYPLTSASSAAALLPQLTSGLVIVLGLHGPACGWVTVGETALAAGKFIVTTSQLDPLSSSLFLHTFECTNCAFGPLSALSLTIDGTCQSVALAMGTVGAQGAVSLSFRSLTVDSVLEISDFATAAPSYLARVVLSSSPAVEVFTDKKAEVRRRGFLLEAPAIIDLETSLSPPTFLSFSVLLPASQTFSGISVVPKFIPVDLVYQLLSCFSFGESTEDMP